MLKPITDFFLIVMLSGSLMTHGEPLFGTNRNMLLCVRTNMQFTTLVTTMQYAIIKVICIYIREWIDKMLWLGIAKP